MGGNDHVDAVHRLGQLIVLGPDGGHVRVVRAGMRKADDEIHAAFVLKGLQNRLGGLGRLLKMHAGHGRIPVGVRSQQAEHAEAHAVSFQNGVFLHAVGLESLPGYIVVRSIALLARLVRPVIGLHDQGQRLPRVPGGAGGTQHGGKALLAEINFMIAESRSVIAQAAQNAQFRRGGGKNRLEQGTHGPVARVHGNHSVRRVFRPLLLQKGIQPGVSAGLAAVFRVHGQKVGVHIVGKQYGRGFGLAFRQRNRRRQQKGQAQKRRQHAFNSLHIPFLSLPCSFCAIRNTKSPKESTSQPECPRKSKIPASPPGGCSCPSAGM